MARVWAKWLRHPCRLGDPHRCRAGGKIRSGALVGKVAMSPLPSRGSPPLQGGGQNQKWPTCGQSGYVTPAVSGIPTACRAGGQNQKWPTCGQSGYVTPAVSGIPTASKRGAKSEVAHLWAKWLRHPCRLGDPHRFKAGGKIRSGPLVGKVAMSPLPSRGSPPLLSGGAKSEVAHLWAKWLRHPCRLGDPHRFRAGGEIRSGPLVGKVATPLLQSQGSPPLQSGGAKSEVARLWAKWRCHPCRLWDPHRFKARGKIRSGPLVGKVAMSTLPSRGSPPLQSGGQNQKWPTGGQSGYITPAVSGITTASKRGAKSEVAHLWAKWLRHPCRLGDPHRLQSGGQNQKWPTCGQSGYVTPAALGIPTAAERGAKSEVARLWAKWLRHPCRLGDPHRFKAGGKIRSGPLVGKVATSPLPSRGSPPLQSGGENQKWPACGQSGYVTPAVSGIPTASKRGAKSEVAHLWAKWLRHPCRLGDPHRCRAGEKIRSGPLVGKVATSPLPSRGSPPLAERGAKSEVAHLWAKWLRHPCRLGDPHRCRAGEKIRSGPLVGKVATSPLPSRGSPPLQSGGQNQKWPTGGQSGYVTPAVSGVPPLQSGGQNQKWPACGQSGYVTPAVSGIPTASERGAKSEVAHLWAKWLRHPCRLGDPHRLQSGGQNQKWPTCGQSGYVTPAALGIPTAARRGAKSEVARLWAKWLRHPCRLGDPHRFKARGKIRSGPLVGKVATSPLPSRGSPPLQSRGQNQKWPKGGQSGYVTPAVSGIPTACRAGGKIRSGPLVGKVATSPLPSWGSPPLQSGGQNQSWPACGQSGYVTLAVSGITTASERGTKSEVAHLWAKWLRHPCRLGDPHRLQSGGQNQKWPTGGQSGYVTPAVSGIPTASKRGAKSEVARLWAKWLRHPCRLGDPHRLQSGGQNQKWPTCGQSGYVTPAVSGIPTACRAGGKIRSGPLVGKVAMSPLPSWGSPPLQSGGQNQSWPACGQSGYVTLAVSGITTASERGTKSEVAHLWAKWLRHPCHLGDPHRFKAGGKIRSGPLVGKVATSPLPSRGSPPLQSGGQNQKWPACGQSGYVTPAVSGIPTASKQGAKSEVAHLWAKWLCHPCRLGDPHRFKAGGKIRSGPLVGKVATSPLPSRGSPPLQSGGENQKWPTCGQSGYVTPAISGIPTASKRGAKSEVAHWWAKWLRHPCRLGDPHRFKAGGKIRSGPLVGKVATSPLPSRGSPPLQSRGQNQKWPTCGQSGYVTPAVSGIPTACRAGGKIRSGPLVGKVATSPLPSRGSPPLQSGGENQKWPACGQSGYVTPAVSGIPTAAERGAKSEVAHWWAKWLRHPCRLGGPTASKRGAKSEMARLWAKWLCHPCRLGDPHRFTAGGKIRSGPLVGKVATSPLPSRGSPPLAERGAKSEVARLWAKWLRHPCRLGDPHRFKARGKIRSGPLVGKVATSPLPSRGSPPLQSRGQNQKWPTCGQSGYVTPAVSGIPTACRAGGKIRSGPLVGKVATSPLPSWGSPPLQSGGQNQSWPACGQSGYVTLAVSGITTASERGTKSEVAHLWAKWLRHPCRLGDPHRLQSGGQNQKWPTGGQSGYVTPAVSGIPTACRAGGKIRSGPLVGKVATSPLPSRGSPPLAERGAKSEVAHLWAKWLRHPCRLGDPHRLQSGGQNQKWPTCGQSGYVTPAVLEIPTAAERGAKSELARLWAKWLRHPCRLGDHHRFRAGDKIRSGPLVGKVATSPLPSRGSPPLQSGGQNQKWPTGGQSGYVTPAVSGIPTASKRGAKSEVARLWAKWLRHPCRLGDPHRFKAGGKIRSGPLVGKVATSPLPSRGSPPLQSGGQNQKWPACGQSGYHPCRLGDPHRFRAGGKIRSGPLVGKVATSPLPSRGSPPLAERGAKSEVAHLWAKWLRHPCRLGDPHRCRAGGKIRVGPLVGKVATSPLPSRGSPPL